MDDDEEILDDVIGCTRCPHQWHVPLCDTGDVTAAIVVHLLHWHGMRPDAALDELGRIEAAA